jgi:O-antigen/teichoic acid export membrane protein
VALKSTDTAASASHPHQSFGQRAFQGLIWSLGQNGAARLLALGSQLLLARLLSSADFGLIGLAYSVQTTAVSLISFGVDDVILQRARTMRLWLGAGLIISLILASAGALLILAASPLAASLYEAPQLTGLLALMALSLPISALSNVPAILLRANLRFKFMAAYTTAELTAQTILTVLLAWKGFGAYSFIIPVPLLAAIKVVVYWRAAGERVTFHRSHLLRWRILTGKGIVTWMIRLCTTGMSQGDYALLGAFTSKLVVGQYYFAYRLAAQPVWILAGNVGQVLLPALSRFRSEPLRQGAAALQAAKLLSFVVMPVAFIQAAIAGPFLTWLFGTKWAASIHIMEVLSIGVALDAVSWIAGSLLAARGEFNTQLRYVAIQLPLFLGAIGCGLYLGQGLGVAIAVAVFYAVTQPVYSYLCFRRGGGTVREVAWIYLGPTLGAALATAAGLLAASVPAIAGIHWLQILVIGAVTSAVYLAYTAYAAPDVIDQVRGRLLGMIKRPAR